MPFAQHHYPFENKEIFEKQFPADFISEAVDQTRGWFYSLLAISTLISTKHRIKMLLFWAMYKTKMVRKCQIKGKCSNPFEALKNMVQMP
jgi:isoleucyl-tRNA synthetase